MYRYIDPFEKKYVIVAEKRNWISERFYIWFILTFGNRVGTRQPFRWILHKEVKMEDNNEN